tara:strand:- start:70 stop:474 length:405 start_codon:yes stop_codon:yes gene_type:complete
MSKSPINFGLVQLASRLTGGRRNRGNLADILGKSRRNIGGRVKKLENQMNELMIKKRRDEALDRGEGVLGDPNVGAMDIGDISQQPGAQQQLTPLVGNQAMRDGMTGNPSFNLGKGQEMFGNSIPDSFDRDMGV